MRKIPSGLNGSKNKVDKLDVDKLNPVSTDLKILTDVVEKEDVKKCL